MVPVRTRPRSSVAGRVQERVSQGQVSEGFVAKVRRLEYLLNVMGSHWKVLSRGMTILNLYFISKPL